MHVQDNILNGLVICILEISVPIFNTVQIIVPATV